ncbi:hypothetical protein, partial [Escherichia coli]|uniref:hypothetical protein n=1 Tax=Escherichia coli TaxID=562 RepID=UPI00201A846B
HILTRFACLLLRRGIKNLCPDSPAPVSVRKFHEAFQFIATIDSQTLTQSHRVDCMFSPSQCDFDGLPFHPINQKPSRLFHSQREKYSHSVVSLRHRSGNAIYPLKRGLFPRHLRAEKTRFFVHARIPDGSSRHAGRKGKKSFKKIVQICALLCIYKIN